MNTKMLLTVALAMTLSAVSALAQSTLHQVSWAHAEPDSVSRFQLLVSEVAGQTDGARILDVGLPEATPTGSMSIYSAMVELSPSEYLAVQAVGPDGVVSTPSSWGTAPPTRPGQPLPVGN